MKNNNFNINNIDIYTNASQKKEEAFTHISQFISNITNIDSKSIIEGLYERENESTTYVGEGIAIPHAIIEQAQDSYIFLHLPSNKVDWNAYDFKPVDIIFTLIIPKKDYNKEHLKQISLLARHLLDQDFQKFLREEKDENKLFKKIKEIQEEL